MKLSDYIDPLDFARMSGGEKIVFGIYLAVAVAMILAGGIGCALELWR